MTTKTQSPLDFGPLVEALYRKTLEKKLSWRETAEDEVFLASVKGALTIEVRRAGSLCELIGRDSQGRVTFHVQQPSLRPYPAGGSDDLASIMQDGVSVSPLAQLHAAARRVALHIDEKLETSLKLIESL